MKGSSSRGAVAENGNISEEIDWEMRPGGMLVQKRDDGGGDHLHGGGGCGGGPAIKIMVVHRSNQFDLVVPSQSTFGDVKSLIAQHTGLEPHRQRLLFRGKERENEEYLHMVGVKDNAKLLLIEGPTSIEIKLEEPKMGKLSSASPTIAEVRPEVDKLAEELASMGTTSKERKLEEDENNKILRACAAVAEVKTEVDKLAEQVAALEAFVHGGTNVGEKKFIVLSELLMRQLLKLDSIEAEGEAKVQRKLEVRRVQGLVDKVDSLKALNSNPFSNSSKEVSVTTKWETFNSRAEIPSTPPPISSSTKVNQDWEQFD